MAKKRIQLRLPPSLIEEVDDVAGERGESRTDFVREALSERLSRLRHERMELEVGALEVKLVSKDKRTDE